MRRRVSLPAHLRDLGTSLYALSTTHAACAGLSLDASLPYRVALLYSGNSTPHRGDFVVFAFEGDGIRRYPGLARQPFFKIVRGLPGDTISVAGREVRINGEPVGIAKTHAFDRHPLEPIAAGSFLLAATSPMTTPTL
jgi:type IV secretory pathway protease TraF